MNVLFDQNVENSFKKKLIHRKFHRNIAAVGGCHLAFFETFWPKINYLTSVEIGKLNPLLEKILILHC